MPKYSELDRLVTDQDTYGCSRNFPSYLVENISKGYLPDGYWTSTANSLNSSGAYIVDYDSSDSVFCINSISTLKSTSIGIRPVIILSR